MSGAGPALGIDLGTTHSAIAAVTQPGRARVLADAHGRKVHPSAVSLHPSGAVLLGADARQRRTIDPANTILGAKRLAGRALSSPEVQELARRLPLTLERGEDDQVLVRTRAGDLAVPEILAQILEHLRAIGERSLATPVGRAVLTVPANFHDRQRAATATAAAIAGIDVPMILNEPTAAAIAYGARRDQSRVIAVYDFGGGTFDVSILELRGRVYEVLATAGDPFLGGDDFDDRIVDAMAGAFLACERLDPREEPEALARLRAEAERLKIELSWRQRASSRLDAIGYGPGGKPLQLVHQLTRPELDDLTRDLVDRTFPVCGEALQRAGLGADAIGDVLLVGGTTRLPHVRERVAQFFGRAARTDIDPDEAVALGAALQAAALEEPHGDAFLDMATAEWGGDSTDVAEERNTLDIPTVPGEATIPRPEDARRPRADRAPEPPPPAKPPPVPPRQTARASAPPAPPSPTRRRHAEPPPPSRPPPVPSPLPGMPPVAPAAPAPDEDTAFEPLRPPQQVLDVTAHTLSVVTVAGYCEPVIARNTRVPAGESRVFTAAREGQRAVRVGICQGESRHAADNVLLGHVELTDLPGLPRAEASIEVTFSLDASGLLRVAARDHGGRAREIHLDLLGAPSPGALAAARERFAALRPDAGAGPVAAPGPGLLKQDP